MVEKRFILIKDTEWWFVQDNTIQVNEFGYREDLTGEDKYRGLQQDLTEQETVDLLNSLYEENEQLKQDNNALIHLLENQSIIIEELYTKLLEYQVKEPIVLTKEDLNLMGKAISYYTHGRYAE